MTEFHKEVSELINSGFAVSEISKKLNRPMNSVSSVIKALNLKVKKNLNENKINHSYFDNIDSDAIIFMKRKHEKIESYLEYRANQIRVKGIWKCNA